MPSYFMIWPDNPGLSLIVGLLGLVFVMFGARAPVHRMIQGVARAITQGCKLTSEAITALQARLAERNRQVLLSSGLQDTEHQIEQEFRRISAAVDRDLAAYPTLHRRLADQVTQIDEDYRRATDTPPAPESWAQTLQAAAELAGSAGSNATAARAVEALQAGIEEAHHEAMDSYRESSRERHMLLSKMVPAWYSVVQRTSEIGIRMALGADAGLTFRLVVGQTLLYVLAGGAIGIAGAIGVSRLVQGLLFEVSPLDPATLVGVLLLLLVTAACAAGIPARRAARVSPVSALSGD